MKINARSMHYRWYCTLHTLYHPAEIVKRPENLCQYGRALFFGSLFFPIVAPLLFLAVICVGLIMVVAMIVKSLSVFFWQTILVRRAVPVQIIPVTDWLMDFDLFKYRPITKARGWGAWVLIPIAGLVWRYHDTQHVVSDGKGVLEVGMVVLITLLATLALSVLVSGIILLSPGIRHLRQSETLTLFKAYIKAKKLKICPLIEVVDE